MVVLAAAVLLAWLAIPIGVNPNPLPAVSMQVVLWEQRVLDLWIQMVLIISGVMGMLGILAEGKTRQRSGLHTLVEVRGQVPQSAEYLRAMEGNMFKHDTDQNSQNGDQSPIDSEDGKSDE